jgi:hypothetical protein
LSSALLPPLPLHPSNPTQPSFPLQPQAANTQGLGEEIRRTRTELNGEPIVISVGLLQTDHIKKTRGGSVRLLDVFTLDIFVLNKSSWTRRFEVSFPINKGRDPLAKIQGGSASRMESTEKVGSCPGLLPLDNHVRVG